MHLRTGAGSFGCMAASWASRPVFGTDLDATLRRIVVILRVLGAVWMLMLVAGTVLTDEGANAQIAIGAGALAAVWTVVTLWAARRPQLFGSFTFFALDGVVALLIGAASAAAGAKDLFHGGYLVSWTVLGAYVFGRTGALGAATLLTVEQIVTHVVTGKNLVRTTGSIVFFVFAFIVGWTFDALRHADHERTRALDELDRQRTSEARREEREWLADRLHDTVLQTLHAINLSADDPQEVRFLARQQERDLRRALARMRSPHKDSYRVALLVARDDVETMYHTNVKAVIRHDAELDEHLRVVVDAAREAMLNAAAHSGSPSVELFSESENGLLSVHVRDRGVGFDGSRITPHRGIGRAAERVRHNGGELLIESMPGGGTECTITMPRT